MGPVENVLRAARERIKKSGWCQHHKVDGEGRHCLIGAVESTYTSSWVHETALELLRGVIGRLAVSSWNDEAGRTVQHVIAALGFAISMARRKGL